MKKFQDEIKKSGKICAFSKNYISQNLIVKNFDVLGQL